jgi:hypothetical protein
MPPENSAIHRLRSIAAYTVGLTVHGSSLFFMIHGLMRNAWYGYVFALIYAVLFLLFVVMIRRARRRANLRFRRVLQDPGGPAGA